jgi:arylsulfatase A-like enzyme
VGPPFGRDSGRLSEGPAGKQKFWLFLRSYDAANGAPDLTGVDNGRNKVDESLILDATNPATAPQKSSNLVNAVLATLSNALPAYLFLHLADPDTLGHATYWGSPDYSNAVRHIDGQIGRVLDAVAANPSLSNQTAMIVTTDHGGGSPTNSQLDWRPTHRSSHPWTARGKARIPWQAIRIRLALAACQAAARRKFRGASSLKRHACKSRSKPSPNWPTSVW